MTTAIEKAQCLGHTDGSQQVSRWPSQKGRDLVAVMMSDGIETVAVMRRQEAGAYRRSNWMLRVPRQSFLFQGNSAIEADCREKMALWCTQVVDFCKFGRETVEIAMSYADRYMMTGRAGYDRHSYQLVCMAALYTAAKIHEPEAMDPKLVSSLSRGAYSPQEIEEMEAAILDGIQWYLNPPTSLSFIRQIMEMVPSYLLPNREAVYELAQFQTELAIFNIDLCTASASAVAYASFLNALESLNMTENEIEAISIILDAYMPCKNVSDIQTSLYKSVMDQPVDAVRKPRSNKSSKSMDSSSSHKMSPRSSIAA